MEADSQRLDRWLWHARVVKTRSLASALVSSGKVRVDGVRTVKPAATIRRGNTLTIVLPGRVRILEVAGFTERRGSATAAATTFRDLSPELPRSAAPDPASPVPGGRPDKRARRQAAAITGKPLD
ncbi:MAG: RNA-binding S4 domain-containing protein [Flavobacteriaceae bacterium]